VAAETGLHHLFPVVALLTLAEAVGGHIAVRLQPLAVLAALEEEALAGQAIRGLLVLPGLLTLAAAAAAGLMALQLFSAAAQAAQAS